MSLWDAEGDYYSSRRDLQLAYTPPKSDLPGAAVALSLITCWVNGRLLFWCYCFPVCSNRPVPLPHPPSALTVTPACDALLLPAGCHVPARHVRLRPV